MSMKLVAVRKNEEGQITHFITDHEQVITFEAAKRMAQNGELDSLTNLESDGTWIIDNPCVHSEGHNLGDLPLF